MTHYTVELPLFGNVERSGEKWSGVVGLPRNLTGYRKISEPQTVVGVVGQGAKLGGTSPCPATQSATGFICMVYRSSNRHLTKSRQPSHAYPLLRCDLVCTL